MDAIVDALLEGLKDTLEIVPFLFVTYLAMEALEHVAAQKTQEWVTRAGHAGPILGALLGAIPQCGFSAMGATLFSARVVSMGTLFAVILSTSDEMLPVFLAGGAAPAQIAALVGAKVAVGMVFGLAVDAMMHLTARDGDGHAHIHELCEYDHCHCDDTPASHSAPADKNPRFHTWLSIGRSALRHTVQVTLFVLVITLVLEVAVDLVGESAVANIAGSHPLQATLVCALVGLIPNCGASVALSELYMAGTIGFGPAFAGLLVSGGVGLLVLFRTNHHPKQNLAITAALWCIGVVCGLVATLFV